MAVLRELFSHGSKAAFDKFKCASLTLFWANVTTENFDHLRRPAIAAIEDGVGGGELRHRRNEHFYGLPVDLDRDHPLISATSLSLASKPQSRANMRTSVSSLRCSMSSA
jgi:hypothetical protein